jgi:hypothetical protein
MLALHGVEKSLIHFRVAMGTGSTCGVDPSNWSMSSQTWDPEDAGEQSIERDFLSRDSGSGW